MPFHVHNLSASSFSLADLVFLCTLGLLISINLD